MKRFLWILMAAILLLGGLTGCDKNYGTVEENTLKIVSYNVRCADDGVGKTIDDRAPRFQVVMERYDPDIMGLQEVTPNWISYLYEYFDDEYDYVHKWRAGGEYEGTPIFWKRDKFELLEDGYFWLNEHPDEEGIAWGADYNRICLWVKLRAKETGREFLFFNTHFDYANEECHVNSAELLIQMAEEMGGFEKYPVLVTADFNMQQFGKGYNAMYQKFADINFQLEDDPTPTTNGYNESSGGSIIDYCFYSPELVTPLKYQVLNEEVDGGYVSDHRGLYIEASVVVEE